MAQGTKKKLARKMQTFYCEFGPYCELRRAYSEEGARRQSLREHGTNWFKFCRPATKKDIGYLRAMTREF